MPKLDLLNTRLDFGTASQSCVYNSLEDRATYSSLNKGMKGVPSASFTSRDARIAKCEKNCGSGSTLPKCDRLGNKCDFEDLLKHGRKTVVFKTREQHFSDVLGNPIAEQFHKSTVNRSRIEGQCMSRVLDNTHDVPAVTLYGSVLKGQLPGGYWDKSKKVDLYANQNPIGPGDYNIKYPGDKVNAVKFSTVKTQRGKSAAKSNSDNSHSKSAADVDAKSPGKIPDDTSILETYTSGSTFASSERFDPRIDHRDFFIKTNGMKLGHDYDNHLISKGRVPISIAARTPKFVQHKTDVVDVDVDPDCGHKKSLATAAQTTTLKYAAVFKSKIPIGTEIPKQPALNHVGPGYYRPKGLSSVEIIDPIRESSMFKTERKFNSKVALPDSLAELPSFADVHDRGIRFMKQGSSSGNVHLQEWTKTKIKKIYPRLAKKKYGTPLPSEVAAAAAAAAAIDRPLTQGSDNYYDGTGSLSGGFAGGGATAVNSGVNSGVTTAANSRCISRANSMTSIACMYHLV